MNICLDKPLGSPFPGLKWVVMSLYTGNQTISSTLIFEIPPTNPCKKSIYAYRTSGDTSGKIEMQQYQVEKGNLPADENMCVLHDRKSE
jgi:hypothetical protein